MDPPAKRIHSATKVQRVACRSRKRRLYRRGILGNDGCALIEPGRSPGAEACETDRRLPPFDQISLFGAGMVLSYGDLLGTWRTPRFQGPYGFDWASHVQRMDRDFCRRGGEYWEGHFGDARGTEDYRQG